MDHGLVARPSAVGTAGEEGSGDDPVLIKIVAKRLITRGEERHPTERHPFTINAGPNAACTSSLLQLGKAKLSTWPDDHADTS